MTLRVAAALALALGISLLTAYLHWVGQSPWSTPEERHLREMKERTAEPDTILTYTFADFVALPHGRPLDEVAALERRAVSLEGYVQGMAPSSDGDFHVNLVDSLTGKWRSDMVTTEVTPQWHRGSSTWSWEALNAALRPLTGRFARWPKGPARARISGWLLYDYQYDEPFLPKRRSLFPEGPSHKRLTGWEIHPVTRIEVWDDSIGAFVDLPR